MDASSDLTEAQYVAVVAVVLLSIVPVAVILAWWLKHRYTRAVVRLQNRIAIDSNLLNTPDEAQVAGDASPTAGAAPTPLVIRIEPCDAAIATRDDGDPTLDARRLRRRVLSLQFASGLLYWFALLVSCGVAAAIGASKSGVETNGEPSLSFWLLTLSQLTALLMPPTVALAFQAGLRERFVWGAYALGVLVFAVGPIATSESWREGLAFAAVCACVGGLFIAFLRPAVRGAGPSLIAALTGGALVFIVALAILIAVFPDSPDDVPETWGETIRGVALLACSAALALAAAGAILLRIARRYAAKGFSELQLALAAFWALVTAMCIGFVLLISMLEESIGAALEVLTLFIVVLWWLWRRTERCALRRTLGRARPPLGALLFLRVFKPSGRSESFTDRFLARWRFAAPVWMIAGPDLTGAFMEPDEFFAYLRRRLEDRFVYRAEDVPEHIARFDDARDPDGRFRVNELFCSNTAWRPAVLQLIERCGVVLLDLREYQTERRGTRYELHELMRRVPLARIVILVDAHDDSHRIRHELQQAWDAVSSTRSAALVTDVEARLRVLSIGPGSGAEMVGLFRTVAAVAGATGLGSASQSTAPVT